MSAFRMAGWRRLGLAFMSGVLLAASFPDLDRYWLAWLAPGLTLAVAAYQPGRQIFFIGLCAGLGRFLVALYWLLLIPAKGYGFGAWLGLSLYLSLFMGAWCWVCWKIAPRKFISQASEKTPSRLAVTIWPISCAAVWVAMEIGYTYILTGFPWALLGTSQYKLLPLIQLASLTGIYGVSFMVVWISVALVVTVQKAWGATRHVRVAVENFGVPLVAFGGVILFGASQLAKPEPATTELKVALIQPSIPQKVIWEENERTNRLNQLLELSRAALAEQPDLLVWPEAALPGSLARTRATQEMITDLVKSHKVWMIFGAEDSGHRKDPAGNEIIDRLTGAFFVNPAGDLMARYHKRHLVVFGEFMPGADLFPFLKRFREKGAGFARGSGPVVFQMEQPRVRLSTLICFEDVFPQLARECTDDDTDFLLNLTNNGWFGESAAQWQHATTALFRAVENGVPLVRCANNGLTCWIDARGRIHQMYFPDSKNIYQAGYKLARIPLRAPGDHGRRTIYNRYGDWFAWSCVLVTAITLGRSFLRQDLLSGNS